MWGSIPHMGNTPHFFRSIQMEYQPYFDIATVCDAPYLKLNLTSEDAKQWLSEHLSYEDEWTEASLELDKLTVDR